MHHFYPSFLRLIIISFLLLHATGDMYGQNPDHKESIAETESFASNLPIMIVRTDGQSIPDDSKIVADMGLIHYGPDMENYPIYPSNQYDGKISIKIRGFTSQSYKKKSYTIELQTSTGENNNVSLLGLPSENDFVLYGPYSDKTLLRNIISFNVFEAMGHWAPRTRLIDLYINEEYIGIYVLTEKIKRDRNRVAIKQLTEDDVSESDISGGYILQVDRVNSLESDEYWFSPVNPPYPGFRLNNFEYYDPERDELTDAQASYIKNWTNNLDAVLASYNYKDSINGYRTLIDVNSFVDYLILHEFNKDIDAYRLSTYFYKESDIGDGKLHAGPPWDYNLTFGNVDYGDDTWKTNKWIYTSSWSRYWWLRLMDDLYFRNEVFCRWDQLKETIMNESALNSMIDSCTIAMGPSIDQNFQQWPILGEYIWPNNFIGECYEEEIAYLKDWISDRIEWLDYQWCDRCNSSDAFQAPNLLIISPNPSDLSHTRLQIPDHQPGPYIIYIHDINGRLVYVSEYVLDAFSSTIFLEDISYLNRGIFMLRISGEGNSYSGKIIRE